MSCYLNTIPLQDATARLIISPNPSNGLFNVRLSGLENQDATITISDITG
ncbi:MAG: hypothetical protein WCJ26_06575 [bacterium]